MPQRLKRPKVRAPEIDVLTEEEMLHVLSAAQTTGPPKQVLAHDEPYLLHERLSREFHREVLSQVPALCPRPVLSFLVLDTQFHSGGILHHGPPPCIAGKWPPSANGVGAHAAVLTRSQSASLRLLTFYGSPVYLKATGSLADHWG